MGHRLLRLHKSTLTWRALVSEEMLALLLAVFIFVAPASAAMRFQERSLYINDNEPNALTEYTISFRYMSPDQVGSVDMLFCNDPIPYQACVTPPGLDVSQAVLTSQSGETGYSILSRSTNRIVLTRTPVSPSGGGVSSYTLSNVRNSSDTSQAFAVRLKSHMTTNATGLQVDFGSVRGQIASGIVLQTQVPPMLIFCVAEQVSENCVTTNDNYYSDMGDLNAKSTLTAQSQMAVGTNASGGFAITANGTPMAAGTSVIASPSTPTQSRPGTDQFGLNLVENSTPDVGNNPEGTWANAIASPGYSQPNRYKYVSGDVVAFSPNVSLMKKFTVSYIVNSSENLRAGVYTTTITYIASGRF